MNDHTMSYPSDAGAATFLLTVRGTMAAGSPDEAREIHNKTAGNPQGVEAAKSLGDLSHNVYLGLGDDHARDLLFIDYWNSASGLGQFFSDPHVQAGGAALFAERVNPLWAPAEDFGTFHLAVPSGRSAAGVGLLRCEVTSLDKAAAAFREYAAATINRARLHGIVSHSLWVRVPDPGTPATAEVIGVDMWLDADEMAAYYDQAIAFDRLGPVFAGTPDTSTWRAAPGEWVEW
jgi:hypothetical protein